MLNANYEHVQERLRLMYEETFDPEKADENYLRNRIRCSRRDSSSSPWELRSPSITADW